MLNMTKTMGSGDVVCVYIAITNFCSLSIKKRIIHSDILEGGDLSFSKKVTAGVHYKLYGRVHLLVSGYLSNFTQRALLGVIL